MGGLAMTCGFSFGVEVGEKPDTPKLPGVPYVVHDGTRPQPRKVQTQGAVTAQAPADAKVLFDGSHLEAWQGGQWKIEDGAMIAHDRDISTKEKFRDFQLHIEWRIPKDRKVKGQSGGNSGVFLMGMYEIQVLASHENQTYPDGQAGAMYGQFPPLVNASSPKGEWNSYDIVFSAPRFDGGKLTKPARVTVLHNGVMIHNAKAYLGPTGHKNLTEYSASQPAAGPIKLQWHGDPIHYRNIWIREIGDYDQQ